jgi:hypothetical protein
MHTTKVKTNVDVEVTLDGLPVDDVLKYICEVCHMGLMDASMTRQDCEENPNLNTAKTWKEECENIEGLLCRILNLLGD